MKKDKLEEILDDLGIKYRNGNKNYLTIACPFAGISRLHKHENDRKHGGYVNYSEDKGSYFGCFTCEHNGSIYKTINKLYDFHKSSKYKEALDKVKKYENKFTPYFQESEIKQDTFFDRLKTRLQESVHPIVNMPSVMYDIDDINNYEYDDNHIFQSYLISRGYSFDEADEIINKFKFMMDKKGKRGVFIVRDFLNHIVGSMELIFSGSESAPKYIAHFKSADYLLNEQVFYNRKYNSLNLIVTEGLLDMTRLSTRSNSQNIVALQGKIKENQMNKILYFSKNVYFFTDMDDVGVENVEKLGEFYEKNKHLFGHIKILVFNDFKKGDDPDTFFKTRDINEYDIKGGFVYWTKFVKQHKVILEEIKEKNDI